MTDDPRAREGEGRRISSTMESREIDHLELHQELIRRYNEIDELNAQIEAMWERERLLLKRAEVSRRTIKSFEEGRAVRVERERLDVETIEAGERKLRQAMSDGSNDKNVAETAWLLHSRLEARETGGDDE